MMKTFFSGLLRMLLKLCLFGVIGAALLFAVYFFNLDMKLTAKLEPIMLKHYDKIKRDTHL